MSSRAPKPTYVSSTHLQNQEPSFFAQLRSVVSAEFRDPESRSANLGVLAGVGLFAGTVALLRFGFGELLLPPV